MTAPEYAEPVDDVDGSEWILVSDHAAYRYRQRRRDECFVGPRIAWFDGVELDDHALEGDEVRYHEPSDTLLVRKDSHIVTAIDVEHARLRTRSAVERVRGGVRGGD